MARKTRMNRITSHGLLSQVNPKNTQLLQDFEEYLKSTQKSEATIAAYDSDIKIAWVWCLQHNDNKFYVDWSKRDVVHYQGWLINENGNSPARVRRLKASLSSLSNYIESVLDDEYPVFRNIINKIESPVNQPVREKTVLSDEQINYLLQVLADRGQYDKACAVALAMYSGRRKAELPRFRVTDFGDDKLVCGGALYKTDKIKTKGRGVQGKQLECFCLAKQFKPYLERWLKFREDNNIESIWLFPKLDQPNEHLQVSMFNSWAKTFSSILGVDFYWHALRHACVTTFIRAGIPDTVVQQYMGWSDISMVPVYSDVKADEQLALYFGAEGFKQPEHKSLDEI